MNRRGILGALAMTGAALAVRAVKEIRGRLVEVRIDHSNKWPQGVMALDPKTGDVRSKILVEYAEKIRALRIGDECSVEALLVDAKGEPYLVEPRLGLARWHAATEWLRLRRVA